MVANSPSITQHVSLVLSYTILLDVETNTSYYVYTTDIYLSGLLARCQNAWSQDGGNMRVIANGIDH